MNKPNSVVVLALICLALFLFVFGGELQDRIWLGGADFELQFTHDGDPDTHGPELLCSRGVSLGGVPCLPILSIDARNVEWIKIILLDAVRDYELISQACGDDENCFVDSIHLRLTRGFASELTVINVYVDGESFTLDVHSAEQGDFFSSSAPHIESQPLNLVPSLLSVAVRELYRNGLSQAGLTENSGFNSATLWVKVKRPPPPLIPSAGTTL